MNSGLSDHITLVRTPEGTPLASDFLLGSGPVAAPQPGQVRVKVLALSLDPYLRSAMAGRHLSAPILPGQVVMGEGLVEVMESEHPRMQPGQRWVAACGWRSAAVLDAAAVMAARPLPAAVEPATLALGVLGMPGLTAWAGVRRLSHCKPGDTFVVSAASGPVGATVGQLARWAGCRVIGIAGGTQKCTWVTQVAGFDACIDYKSQDLRLALRQHCPNGINVYFDNVGGDVLQAVCEQLAPQAQLVLCGLIAQYGSAPSAGPNPGLYIRARATLRGLVVYDHWDAMPQMLAELLPRVRSGELAYREDVSHGLASTPEAFARLMRGANQGKALVIL